MSWTTRRCALGYSLLLALLAGPALAADDQHAEKLRAEYVRSHYNKFEYRIPMRDGRLLFTAVYRPADSSRDYPFLMLRTPYSVGPYGADRYKKRLGPHEGFEREGFIFVFQDVRGKYLSEGEFVNMRPHLPNKKSPTMVDESTDTWDTIEWLLDNLEGHNGKVGQWGNSYPGFYTAAGAIDSHPALAAISPQAPIADWYWDDMHRHGAFVLPLAFNFFSSFGQPRPEPTTERVEGIEHGTADGYQFFLELGPLSNVNEKHFQGEVGFWNDLAAHPNYDEFWQARNLLPHLKGIGAAVMTVGGWFDTEDLYGPLEIYRSIEEKNPKAWNMLVMGPWPHGGWNRTEGDQLGDAEFGFPTAAPYRRKVLDFFRHFLKGAEPVALPEAWMFETGANRWREFDTWPPQDLRRAELFLHEGGALAFDPPTRGETSDQTADLPIARTFDEFVSDPAKPVPYTMEITTRWARNYMVEDQRFAAWRPDVLVYRGAELTEDLTLAGPLEADLWVSTSAGDADWVVKLIDVFPGEIDEEVEEDRAKHLPPLGGRQQLVRVDIFRGRFRNSYEHPEPFVAGQPTRLRFEIPDVLHTWKRGHRLMIQIQSSFFPLIDRNPQTWVENIFEARTEDFVKATHRVYRSAEHPSRLRVGILD